jgi:hypothetical protein
MMSIARTCGLAGALGKLQAAAGSAQSSFVGAIEEPIAPFRRCSANLPRYPTEGRRIDLEIGFELSGNCRLMKRLPGR